jgi:hypothetical protein
MTTDLLAWYHDWQGVLGCFTRPDATVPCFGPVSKFPLAYLANSTLFTSGIERGQRLLTIVNGLILLLPLVALAFSQGLGTLRRAGWPYVLAIALSPIPMFYVEAGALEVQAGIFCGIYLGAVAHLLSSPGLDAGRRTAWVIAVSGMLFPFYKDTAAVLVGLAVLVTLAWHIAALRELASTSAGRGRLWRCALLVAGPVLLAQLIDLAYCWFKYGVPLPLAYMYEAKEAGPTLAKSVEFFAGSVFSPNGGILVFWGLPAFLAIACWRAAGLVPRRSVVVLGSATVVVFSVALARWWAPFGWDAWGDRLMVPAMVAVFVGFLFCMRPRDRVTEVAFSWPVALACMPVVAYSFFYVVVPYSQSQARSMQDSLYAGPACERMGQSLATPQPSSFWRTDIYYLCARERMLYVPRPKNRTP